MTASPGPARARASRAQRAGSSTRTRPSACALGGDRRNAATSRRDRGQLRRRAHARAGRRRVRRSREVRAPRPLAPECAARLQRPLPRVDRRSRSRRRSSSTSHEGAAPRSRGTRTASRIRGWYGDGWAARERAARPAAARGRSRVLPERVLQARRRTGSTVSGADHGRCCTTRSTRGASSPPSVGERPLTLLLGGNQYQRYRLEVALETLALVRRERPDARLLVAGELSFSPGDCARRPAGRRARRLVHPGGGARAHAACRRPAAHEVQRPVPDRRARGDGVRPSGRLLERAAARPSSSATTPESASTRRSTGSMIIRRRPKRSPRRCSSSPQAFPTGRKRRASARSASTASDGWSGITPSLQS